MKDLMSLFETTGTYHKMTAKEQQLVDAKNRTASKYRKAKNKTKQ